MANQPRADNPHRSVRVEDELWEAARLAAEVVGTTRGDIMRRALRELVAQAEGIRELERTARRPKL